MIKAKGQGHQKVKKTLFATSLEQIDTKRSNRCNFVPLITLKKLDMRFTSLLTGDAKICTLFYFLHIDIPATEQQHLIANAECACVFVLTIFYGTFVNAVQHVEN